MRSFRWLVGVRVVLAARQSCLKTRFGFTKYHRGRLVLNVKVENIRRCDIFTFIINFGLFKMLLVWGRSLNKCKLGLLWHFVNIEKSSKVHLRMLKCLAWWGLAAALPWLIKWCLPRFWLLGRRLWFLNRNHLYNRLLIIIISLFKTK